MRDICMTLIACSDFFATLLIAHSDWYTNKIKNGEESDWAFCLLSYGVHAFQSHLFISNYCLL
jgi:hypothetical protein